MNTMLRGNVTLQKQGSIANIILPYVCLKVYETSLNSKEMYNFSYPVLLSSPR